MAHYNPKTVLRQVSNALLREFFEGKGHHLAIAWDEITETQIQEEAGTEHLLNFKPSGRFFARRIPAPPPHVRSFRRGLLLWRRSDRRGPASAGRSSRAAVPGPRWAHARQAKLQLLGVEHGDDSVTRFQEGLATRFRTAMSRLLSGISADRAVAVP